MSEDRQKTFGGSFRQFCKDLKEMADITSSPNIHNLILDEGYRKRIQDLESRIIWAIQELEAHGYFSCMEIGFSFHGFYKNWQSFRELPEKWDLDKNEIEWAYPDMRFTGRDWGKESDFLSKYQHKFDSAKPKYREEAPEWAKNFRTDAASKDTTQIWDTDNRTFGGLFRLLTEAISHLIERMNDCIHNQTPEASNDKWKRVQNLKRLVSSHVLHLSDQELLGSIGSGMNNSRDRFMSYWNCLRVLSYEWEESNFNYSKPASDIDEVQLEKLGKWERYCDTPMGIHGNVEQILDGIKLKKDRDTLMEIHINIHWAYPRRSRYDVEWTKDFEADWSRRESGGRYITFRAAFVRLLIDLITMRDLTDKNVHDLRRLSQEKQILHWGLIHSSEEQVIENVPLFSEHPFFEHLTLGWPRGHDGFKWEWEKLEAFSSQMYENTPPHLWDYDNIEEILVHRDWERYHESVKGLCDGLVSVTPKGFKEHPEWTRFYLDDSQLMKPGLFLAYSIDYF